jgi:hypothetical protein
MVPGGVVGTTVRKDNFTCVYIGNISQYYSGERCDLQASCSDIQQLSPLPVAGLQIKPMLRIYGF